MLTTIRSDQLLTSTIAMCADLGLLDLLQFQSKLPGLLLYAVALGGYSGDALLQRGSISTLLSQAENKPYNLNFTLDPVNNHRVRPCSLQCFSQQ